MKYDIYNLKVFKGDRIIDQFSTTDYSTLTSLEYNAWDVYGGGVRLEITCETHSR